MDFNIIQNIMVLSPIEKVSKFPKVPSKASLAT